MKRAKVTEQHKRIRRADTRDEEVGRRVRSRRLECGMTQTELADGIGVTFQQVQKYERGANRIGASRLQGIAETLKVPITFFFDNDHRQPDSVIGLQSPDAVRLMKALHRITNKRARDTLVRMAEEMAGS
jgi:transcriptional regulator with XRE-family HTH domain